MLYGLLTRNKIKIMKPEQSGRVFDHLDSRYKITVYHGSNVIEIEEQIKLSWWKSLWRIDGQGYIWKRIYFGHITPLEEFTKFYLEVVVR
jgi:hypothetical protein